MTTPIDIARRIGAVDREVFSREHNGKPARAVIATRTYDTTADDIWDALTSAERIPRWFLPVSGDLRLGGRYQLQGNAGGTITTCNPPRHLAITWEYGGDITWVDVKLEDDPTGGTRLRLEHLAHVPEERWDQFGPGAVGVGWDLALHGLGLFLATGKPNDAKAFEAWTISAEGKDFLRRASDDWGRAAIAGGDDAAAAKEAAGRTYGFYSGEGPPSK